jgi:DNA-binding response OmpR family regulator
MRVLVVEDEPVVAGAVRKGLEAAGHTVDVAEDGTEGVWQATEVPYDVILLDIMLPRLSGLEVCRRLRAAGVWTPILMLTARDGESNVASALDLGADDYLPKPFSFVVLLARMRALARRGARPRPAVIEIGGLTIDPAARKCLAGDREVSLTAREYAVLEYLARNHERVVSKLDVLENVWDVNFDGDPNIVEVYVRRLRSKLPLQAARVEIRTIRGAGYRLEALEETGGP